MRLLLLLALVSGISLHTCEAAAQDATSTELRLLPEYRPCTFEGTRYACYTAEQQAALNALEVQARGWERQLRLSEDLRLNLDQLVINLQSQINEYVELMAAHARHESELAARLAEEIEAKNRYRREAENTDWLTLTIGVGVGVLGLGFGLGAFLTTL